MRYSTLRIKQNAVVYKKLLKIDRRGKESMIFYFTATGNSRFVADRIAAATGDQTKDITECMKSGQFTIVLAEGENLGFVTPVYYYGIPVIFTDFLSRLDVSPNNDLYTYVVLNCGGTTGNAERYIRRHIRIDAVFGIKTVDNYVPMYKTASESEVTKQLDAAELETDKIVSFISSKTPGVYNPVAGRLSSLITSVAYPLYTNGRKTKKFRVNDQCTGCKLCGDICPRHIIDCTHGKPQWRETRCEICLACLHRCPASAIEYGKSAGRGQYVNPRVEW